MQTGSTKITLKIKRDQNGTNGSTLPVLSENQDQNGINGSDLPDLLENTSQNPVDLSSSDEEEDNSIEDEENQSNEDAQKQLVIYNPSLNGGGHIVPVPDLNDFQLVPIPKKPIPFHSNKPLPSVGAFTVQCAKCFKWRLIPKKEKYEEIREHILEKPFYCETAMEWRPNISCEDPPDISQDGSRLWAIDKPNIAQPPAGWQRLLRIRGEGGSKFADVYYAAPTGKRLRSMVEVQKFLLEHPEYVEAGVQLSQFSFQIPRPLQENYVRKRPKLPTPDPNSGMPGLLEPPSLVNPLAWASPDENTDLRLGGPGLSTPFSNSHSSKLPINRPKKRAKNPSNESTSNHMAYDDQQTMKVVEPSPPVAVVEPSPPVAVVEPSPPVAVVKPSPPVAVVEPSPPVAVVEPSPPVAMEDLSQPINGVL